MKIGILSIKWLFDMSSHSMLLLVLFKKFENISDFEMILPERDSESNRDSVTRTAVFSQKEMVLRGFVTFDICLCGR